MTRAIVEKSNYILSALVLVFTGAYILFSSLATSLDFKMDQIIQAQGEVKEEYEQLMSNRAQFQGKDYLAKASFELKLVEINLTAGYLDIRPAAVESVEVLAKRQ